MNLLFFSSFCILILNLAGFLMCSQSKRRAKKALPCISDDSLLFVGLCGGIFGVLFGMKVFGYSKKQIKLKMLMFLELLMWSVAAIHMLSAFTLDRQIQYLQVSYSSPSVPEDLDGYIIAFVTDTHALPGEELRQVVRKINEYRPNLMLLGGDFPSIGEAPERSIEILSGIEACDGIYGVEGNHDNWQKLFAAMEKNGITALSNSGVSVREGLYLAGLEDLWNRSPDIAKATEGAGEDDFVLLLTHNPDVTMKQNTENVDLALCGHTHGGYVTLFGFMAPALEWIQRVTQYGQHFMSGWAKSRDGADVFVSNGTGYFELVPRVFARPQVILITLKHV